MFSSAPSGVRDCHHKCQYDGAWKTSVLRYAAENLLFKFIHYFYNYVNMDQCDSRRALNRKHTRVEDVHNQEK